MASGACRRGCSGGVRTGSLVETLALLPSIPGNIRANLASICGETACTQQMAEEVMIVTLGADGAAAVTRDGAIIEAPALSVDVVDTTGAGDSFVGSFLAAWLNDCPLPQALNLACAAGSLQVTCFGARSCAPPLPT